MEETREFGDVDELDLLLELIEDSTLVSIQTSIENQPSQSLDQLTRQRYVNQEEYPAQDSQPDHINRQNDSNHSRENDFLYADNQDPTPTKQYLCEEQIYYPPPNFVISPQQSSLNLQDQQQFPNTYEYNSERTQPSCSYQTFRASRTDHNSSSYQERQHTIIHPDAPSTSVNQDCQSCTTSYQGNYDLRHINCSISSQEIQHTNMQPCSTSLPVLYGQSSHENQPSQSLDYLTQQSYFNLEYPVQYNQPENLNEQIGSNDFRENNFIYAELLFQDIYPTHLKQDLCEEETFSSQPNFDISPEQPSPNQQQYRYTYEYNSQDNQKSNFYQTGCSSRSDQHSQERQHNIIHPDTPSSYVRVEKKSVKCTVCEKKFSYLSQLRRHVRLHASPEFACEICGKRFKRQNNLRVHELVHEKQKSYKCPHCEYKTSWKECLTVHIRKHTVQKLHKCDQCVFSSDYKKNQSRHVNTIHEKKFPNICPECGEEFMCRHSINAHMAKIHNKKLDES